MDMYLLKQITILYVEDDSFVRDELTRSVSFLFKHIYIACDGKEATEVFAKHYNDIDVVISDINMPRVNGIELLEKIRRINNNIPFIVLSAYTDVNYLMKSIKFNATEYITKPFDLRYLIERIELLYINYTSPLKIKKQTEEISRYVDALNQVAIVSKTNAKGIITYVNDIFCDVAEYKREELIGHSHNMVRHPDMPKDAFKSLWNTVKNGKSWKGKVKNRTKSGSAYYVNTTIIPLFDEFGKNIIEYIGIRFLTTNDELEKREFKRKVVVNLKESRKREENRSNEILLLQNKLKLVGDTSFLEESLQTEKKRNKKLRNQIHFCEKEVKEEKLNSSKQVKIANTQIQKATLVSEELRKDNKNLINAMAKLKLEVEKENKELLKAKKLIDEQNKKIRDLRDVINFREKEIKELKG